MIVRNVHARHLPVPAAAAGALLDGLAGPDDRLWPRGWPPMRLEGGLRPGARGGHGPIRYRVAAHERGRCARFVFEPPAAGFAAGLRGVHRFEVEPVGAAACTLRHVLEVEARLPSWLKWHVVIGPLHDALLEDALDGAERQLTGAVASPARRSAWVRLLRRALRRG